MAQLFITTKIKNRVFLKLFSLQLLLFLEYPNTNTKMENEIMSI